MSSIEKYLFILFAAAIGDLSANAVSMTVPFADTFSSNPLTNTAVYSSQVINGTVNHLPLTDQLEFTSSGGGLNSSLSVKFSDLGGSARSNFYIFTAFTLPTTYYSVWLSALSSGAGYTLGYSAGYESGVPRVIIYKGSSILTSAARVGNTTGLYSMSLKGTYVTNGLELTLTLNSGTNSQSVVYTDTGTLQTNQFFGLTARTYPGTPLTVDEFSVISKPKTPRTIGLYLIK